MKEAILKVLQEFNEGKWGYYIKPIDNNTNMIMYIYDENGMKETNTKEWMKKQGLNPEKIDFGKVIEEYKRVGIITEI